MTGERETPFSVDAAHAADREKRVSYAPRPPYDAPDLESLRARALTATRTARAALDDGEDTDG